MTSREIQGYRTYLVQQVESAHHQHDDRASGAFGPERNTPEQLGFWRGCASGYQAALDELDLRLEAIRDNPLGCANCKGQLGTCLACEL